MTALAAVVLSRLRGGPAYARIMTPDVWTVELYAVV